MKPNCKFVQIFLKADKLYVSFSNFLSVLSGLCLLIAMILAFFDIVLAKAFNSGVPGQYEMIQMLSVPMLYLTLSYTQLTRGQIKLTLILNSVPKALKNALVYLGYTIGTFMSFFMAWHSFRYVLKLISINSVTDGVLNLPQWPFCMCLVLGCFFLGIAYIFSIIRRAIGRDTDQIEEDAAQQTAENGGDAK